MANITQPAPTAPLQQTAIARAIKKLLQWRHADIEAIANKSNHDYQVAEYRLRKGLRAAADQIKGQGGQP